MTDGTAYTEGSATGQSSSGLPDALHEELHLTESSSGSRAVSTNSAKAITESKTDSENQTLRPVIEKFHSQGYSLEEMLHRATGELMKQQAGTAIFRPPGLPSVSVQNPRGGAIGRSKLIDKKVHDFKNRIFKSSSFVTAIGEAEEAIALRREKLRLVEVRTAETVDEFLF